MSLYLFIDAAYLHEAYGKAMEMFYGTVPTINYRDLISNLPARPRTQRIYYYDAINRNTGKDETADERDARVAERVAFHSYLNSLTLWHVREGFVSRGRRRREPARQKAVDVQLAVDALEHAVARNMTHAAFILGDLDFEPLLFSLNRYGIHSTVLYERESASAELLEAADERIQLTLETFYNISDDSFKLNAPRVSVQLNAGKPDNVAVVRRGTWKGRSVELLRNEVPDRTPMFYLWAEHGPEGSVRQPTRLALLIGAAASEDKTELLFTMTYDGDIIWE